MVADLWSVLAQLRLDTLIQQYRGWLINLVVFAGTVGFVYVLGRYLVVPPIVRAVDRRNPSNETIVDAVGLYLRVAFVVISIPIAVAGAGFGGVVAGSTVIVAAATLALGVAGQDVIGNFVSGVFLVSDPGFNIGDYIEWEDRAGTIRQIDLRVTRLQTPGGDVVIVPNTDIATSAIRLPYSSDQYRLTQRFTIGYHDSVDRVRTLLAEELAADSRVAADPEPVIQVSTLGGSAVELTVWFWVRDPKEKDLVSIRSDFATRAKDRLIEEGVSIAPATPYELSGELAVDSSGGRRGG